MPNTTWTPIPGYDQTDFTESLTFEFVHSTKTIEPLREQTIVTGEKNSQFIKFKTRRYFDGIDLVGKEIQVIFLSAGDFSDINSAVNAEYNDEWVQFGWIVPEGACTDVGKLCFSIEFVDDDYVMKSQKYEIDVKEGLNGAEVVPEPVEQAWYVTLQERCARTLSLAEEAEQSLEAIVAAKDAVENEIEAFGGSPLTASTAAGMTDTTRVYVYTGSETGYTAGNWYYYNGSSWASGGVYNAVAVQTDTTLSVSGKAADAKKVGDELADVKGDLSDILVTSETTYITFNTRGGINAGDGHNNNATNRCRHTGYVAANALTPGDKAYVSVAPGYKVAAREWDGTATATNTYIGAVAFADGGDWATGTDSFTVTAGHGYRFIIAKTDDSDIAPSGIPSNVMGYYHTATTDRTLTLAGKAADAKVVGDMLAEFDVAVNTVEVTRWLNGGITASTGNNNPQSNRCRSKGYITGKELSVSGVAIIKVASGYKVGVREWDEDMEYVGYPAFDGSGFATGEASFAVTANHSYRFIIGKTDDSDITKADIPEGVLGYSSRAKTDPSLTIYGKAADAGSVGDAITPYNATSPVGNSTILAAKYFTFADGTQPVIDWYLLCDINNNLYISKDLMFKRYIGNFPNADKYKFGIRQNGDIIAVFRNEFSDTGETYDSTLDNVRQNPFVLLKDENYTRTEVEFGNSLKPTGWIENCGFCSLPNGDIIFGEYTRMMVLYTSNLWRIKATDDITDPESWEVIKSFTVAENDTDNSYDESVIEHFHTVQVDPYTGIVYFATGDTKKKSQIWWSDDNGDTWTQQSFVDPADSQTKTSGEKLFRLLNFNFTEDYVYWSSDSSTEHAILRCERDVNGGFDADSMTILATLSQITGNPATYGTVLYEDLGLMVLMERCDATAASMAFRAYDFVNDEVVTICTINTTGGVNKYLGFRTEYTEFDPPDGVIRVGFGSNSKYRNVNALCGNTGNMDWKYNVNNLWIRICKDYAGNVRAKFGTYYI